MKNLFLWTANFGFSALRCARTLSTLALRCSQNLVLATHKQVFVLVVSGCLFTTPAFAQISTDTDAGFMQLTPEQEKAIAEKSAKPDMEITGGDTSYVPAPRENPPQEVPPEEQQPEAADTTLLKAGQKGHEVCDVVAHVIARDFRVMVTNPHSRTIPIPTVGTGPYEVAIKSIVPYSSVYTAMGCDGKKLQTTIANTLKRANDEQKKAKKKK